MTLKRKVDLLTVIMLLFFSVLFYITFRSYGYIVENDEAVRTTDKVLLHIRKSLTHGIDLETGSRGFIITGRKEFLEPFEAANLNITPTLDTLRRLLENDQQQTRRLDTLQSLLGKRNEIGGLGIAIRRTKGSDSAAAFILSGKGKRVMDSIRVLTKKMEDSEMQNLLVRIQKSKNDTLQSKRYLIIISFLVSILLFVFYFFLRKNASQLEKTNHAQQITLHNLNVVNEELKISGESLSVTIQKLTDIRQRLEESEDRYRLISAHSKDLISLYGIDQSPKRLYVSPSSKEIMGYEPEEMIGRSSFDFILQEDADKMREFIHPKTLSGNSATVQYRAVRKDGKIIWLETISNPYFDEHGKMIGFQTSARDITQRKHFEKELVREKEKAEKATAKLRGLLVEKNDLIGLFSHDMRAPINQVKGLARIMSSFLHDKETLNDCISRINQAVNRQLALYQDVLYMMKSDQASLDGKSLATVSLASIMTKISQTLDLELKHKKINFQNDIPETVMLTVDQELFAQAMQNLLSNAIKFSYPCGTILATADASPGSILISLRDTGIGFDPEKSERLFDRFTKEGRMGTDNEDSTGLGLYLVRKIIENHKGTITAYSDGKNKGAVFTITLPVA